MENGEGAVADQRPVSVLDYDTKESLQIALTGSCVKGGGVERQWELNNLDQTSSDAQNLEEEMTRLQVLKSYWILDSEKEYSFERITGLASRMFEVPIALVSIVDFGRQWFMSNRCERSDSHNSANVNDGSITANQESSPICDEYNTAVILQLKWKTMMCFF